MARAGVRRWASEPLLHFFVLGVVVLGGYRWIAPTQLSNRIELSPAVINGLRQDHVRRAGALPTAEEEAAMVERFVDQEVLYREALALGLDRGDIIVRRRLVQKMEFLTEDLEPVAEPTEAELQAYMDTHAERYHVPARVSLEQVFASSERSGDRTAATAQQLRAQLLGGAEPAALGDPFVRGRAFTLLTERDLAAIFGTVFARQVMDLAVGTWSEPLASSYGLHLVRVSQHQPGFLPALGASREQVRRDWLEARRAAVNRAALDRLRRRYDIHIAGAGSAAPAALALAR
ncbi:MAG: peptidyl-prolyl cis-trans isomerase [Deltaproteobacteria bacterium]|nr:peptidyl-prolyl cis-trans isomerase [Deltaproteobacteria bacterium]